MKLLTIIKRKKFYENVTFASKEAQAYLEQPIYFFAERRKFEKFEYITNYVSHATAIKQGKTKREPLNIKYPITISGTSILDIKIEDSKNETFHIAIVPPHTIIYYEIEEGEINLFIAKYGVTCHERRFRTQITENSRTNDRVKRFKTQKHNICSYT